MKLTSIDLHPLHSTDTITLSFKDPSGSNPYNIKNAVGLDADEIVPRYYGRSGNSKFYSLSLERREVSFNIGLNPRFSEMETYSSLRDALYRVIASARTGAVHIHFMNEEEVLAHVSGFVTKFESPHFEKNQEVIITIKCDEAMLRPIEPTIVDVSSMDPLNTNIQDLISTAPHGFKFELDIIEDEVIEQLVISDPTDSSWVFDLQPITGFQLNDRLYFSSEHNDKYLYILRDSEIISIVEAIQPGSMWPIMFPGDNNFTITDPENVSWNAISYFPTYWGV